MPRPLIPSGPAFTRDLQLLVRLKGRVEADTKRTENDRKEIIDAIENVVRLLVTHKRKHQARPPA